MKKSENIMKMIVVYNEFCSKILYPSHVNTAKMSSKVNQAPFPSAKWLR